MSCQPIVFPPCPTVECPEQIVYASQNGNLNGVGVLDSNTASLGTFRGVNGDGQYISTTLDAANLSITVALIAAAIPAAIPQATETVAGKGEVATQAETNAGVSDTTFVTPLKLQTRQATTVLTGLLRLATVGEAAAAVNNTAAITPFGVGLQIDNVKQTQTFANAAARAAAVPDFNGQVGVQTDTEIVYTSTGTLAGNWQSSFIQANTTTTFTAETKMYAEATSNFILGTGTTDLLILTLNNAYMDGTWHVNAAATLNVDATASLNFATTGLFKINNASVPADSLLATSATAGRMSSYAISTFLSEENQQAWDVPTGTIDRTTFNTATVTLPELAERVYAILDDLFNVRLPQGP